ncbi:MULTISPECIES: flippase [unclassified Gemella]|uniref:flippase n=1 Tax=unclassified Gemella TaxID=2624949 RepID=UPI00107448C2|nr:MULTISPECIES: flippase [unclassified Gemella]MBF0709859.1 flippase [Gemella sp. GL1.1]MBF0746837.1 flippase [Gemella sp. 19428wG2_WT2a]NYS27203.1 flippase [Gemella sp. GL1]TFU59562.1 flippase [Gemella sp. WT2a]
MGLKSLKLNFIMNMILTVSNFLFPLVTFPYISRVLQAEGVGKVTFIASVIAYFALFAQLGIPTYGIRASAKVRNNKEKLAKTVQEIFLINLIMTILVYTILAVVYLKVDRISQDGTLFVITSLTLLFNLIGMEWLYKGLEEYAYITIRSIIFKLLAVIFMFLFVHDIEDYVIYGAITIFAASASSILNFINIRKHVSFYSIRKDYNLKQHMRPILIFFTLSCATTIYTNLDTVMLGFMHNDIAVGYYTTSIKIKYILLSIVTSLGVVLLPRLSFYIQNGDKDKFMELSNKSFQFLTIIGFSITLYFIIYAKEAVYFLAGESFKESILPMQIILPTVILIGITNLFGIQILVPLGKEKLVVYSVIAGAIINLILNIWLIPQYSYLGTAFANLIAESVVLLVQMYFIRDMIKDIVSGNNYISIIFSLILASITSIMSVSFIDSDFSILIVSAVTFFVTYYVILRMMKNKFVLDIEKQIFRRF